MKNAALGMLFVIACIGLLGSCGKEPAQAGSAVRYDGPAYVIEIVDTTKDGSISTDSALEEFYSDGVYTYYFPSIKSIYIQCTLSDGSVMDINEALAKELVNLSDLDYYGISYYMQGNDGTITKGHAPEAVEADTKDDGRRY